MCERRLQWPLCLLLYAVFAFYIVLYYALPYTQSALQSYQWVSPPLG